jgi:hypothetical protein
MRRKMPIAYVGVVTKYRAFGRLAVAAWISFFVTALAGSSNLSGPLSV